METTNRLYRADRPDRFKNFLRRSGRSYGNQALVILLSSIHVNTFFNCDDLLSKAYRPDRPSRLKIGPSDRDDHMKTQQRRPGRSGRSRSLGSLQVLSGRSGRS